MKKLLLVAALSIAAILGASTPQAHATPFGYCTTADTSVRNLIHYPGIPQWGEYWNVNCNGGAGIDVILLRHQPSDCSGCYYNVEETTQVVPQADNNVSTWEDYFSGFGCNNNNNYALKIRFLNRNGVLTTDTGAYTGTNAC